MIDPAVRLLVSVCGAALFATAAIHKLLGLGQFKAALQAYDILSAHLIGMATVLLPLTELLLAFGLCVAPLRSASLVAAALLLGAYALAIAINLRRGRRYIDCGCLGFGERRPIVAWMVTRNLTLALLFACVAALPESVRILQWLDALTVAGGVVISALLYVAAEELFAHLPHLKRSGETVS